MNNFLNIVSASQTRRVVTLSALAALVAGAIAVFSSGLTTDDTPAVLGRSDYAALPAMTITVFGSSTDNIISQENSWPGELVSLGNLPVQPMREGAIAAWYVTIGKKVAAGEILGRLSRPPAMPETVGMLAERAAMTAMARSERAAMRDYASERAAQLEARRATLIAARNDAGKLLSANKSSMIAIKKENVRAILRGTLIRAYPMFSGNSTLPPTLQAIILRSAFGVANSRLRDTFPTVFFAALSDLEDIEKVPEESGLAFFALATKLADASIADGTEIMDKELAELQSMLHADERDFIMALDELREAEMRNIETGTMYADELRMIDEELAMLKKDLAAADGAVAAKEAAERMVRASVEDGLAIVAPRAGTVSAITKRPGDYVMPGVPVAVITGNGSETIVRMSIPSNVRVPEIGTILLVTRPGFPNDVREARLIGVGAALDGAGARAADAIITNADDWPVGASVRVMPPPASVARTIPISAVVWDADGKPFVWAVSNGDRIFKKSVTLGRTFGPTVELYDGLVIGERYIADPSPETREDMLVYDLVNSGNMAADSEVSDTHAGHRMEGMDM